MDRQLLWVASVEVGIGAHHWGPKRTSRNRHEGRRLRGGPGRDGPTGVGEGEAENAQAQEGRTSSSRPVGVGAGVGVGLRTGAGSGAGGQQRWSRPSWGKEAVTPCP